MENYIQEFAYPASLAFKDNHVTRFLPMRHQQRACLRLLCDGTKEDIWPSLQQQAAPHAKGGEQEARKKTPFSFF